ncbi:TPA: hypothetical protein PC598_001167 [Morganella morganii]|nr:hypothetical protein [Morganella morganii]
MSQYELDYSFSDAYQSTLNNISNELRKEAETIAYMHIRNPEVRMKFLRDISQYISRNEWEVRNACLSLSAGLDNIEIYKYIDTDFIATWRLMSPANLSSEDFLDTITIYSTYDVYNKNKK